MHTVPTNVGYRRLLIPSKDSPDIPVLGHAILASLRPDLLLCLMLRGTQAGRGTEFQ